MDKTPIGSAVDASKLVARFLLQFIVSGSLLVRVWPIPIWFSPVDSFTMESECDSGSSGHSGAQPSSIRNDAYYPRSDTAKPSAQRCTSLVTAPRTRRSFAKEWAGSGRGGYLQGQSEASAPALPAVDPA